MASKFGAMRGGQAVAEILLGLAAAPRWCQNSRVEKRKPTYDLEAFKLVSGDPQRLSMTVTAAHSASDLGLDFVGVAQVVRSMRATDFYKSMTSYGNHRQWQDVYHVPWQGMTIYLKFTADAITAFMVLSFKER